MSKKSRQGRSSPGNRRRPAHEATQAKVASDSGVEAETGDTSVSGKSGKPGRPAQSGTSGKIDDTNVASGADDVGSAAATSDASAGVVPAAPEPGTGERDIRGVLIQVVDARLLLPNATVAEVLSFADPEPVADAPPWLLGRIRWQGWQLPLVAFSKLAGLAEERGALGRKVVVLRALGGNPKAPYFALLTQGFPRLVTVSRETLLVDEAADQADPLPGCTRARVRLNQDDAFVPDLEAIEHEIGSVLAQAA